MLSPAGLVQALTYWAPADPDTMFEGVESLPPGCVLAIEQDGTRAADAVLGLDVPVGVLAVAVRPSVRVDRARHRRAA